MDTVTNQSQSTIDTISHFCHVSQMTARHYKHHDHQAKLQPSWLAQDSSAAGKRSSLKDHFSSPLLLSRVYMQEVHPEETDLSPLSQRSKFSVHTDHSYHLLLIPSPETLLIHIITFLIAAEVPTQGDKSTLWPTCLPQHESFTTLSPWYDCSCTHPICQRALFPATCCAFLEITKKYLCPQQCL